jgi:hypothetical protein
VTCSLIEDMNTPVSFGENHNGQKVIQMGGVSVWRWALLLLSVTVGLVAYVVRPGLRTLVSEHLAAPSPRAPTSTLTSKVGSMKSRTKAELLQQARDLAIRGRSTMTKEELVKAIRSRSDRASQNHANPVS